MKTDKEAAKATSQKAKVHLPGEGVRAIKTTNVFRIVNFELYAKPNIVVMTFGVFAMLFSGAYLAYMKSQMKANNTYVAISDDETQTVLHRKSKWD